MLSETAGRLNFDGLRQRLKTAGLKLHACEHRLDPALRHGLQRKQDILTQKTQQLHPRALRRDIAQGHKDLALRSRNPATVAAVVEDNALPSHQLPRLASRTFLSAASSLLPKPHRYDLQ